MNNTKKPSRNSSNISAWLWVAVAALVLGLLFARALFPELTWLSVIVGVLLVAALGALLQQNRAALKTRAAAYGINSAVTIVLVIAIVGLVNFLGERYPLKWDATKNKIHTLSDQTVKMMKGLKKPVQATLFVKSAQREKFRMIMDEYKALSPKFAVEYVDPDREPTRAKQAGIKKYGTLHLVVGPRDSNIEDVTEEKVTNALIKLLKDKSPILCSITGHGEKSFMDNSQNGLDAAKRGLTDQAYQVKEVSLVQEGKVPADCDAIAIIGPTKAFFPAETKLLNAYFANGGRGVIALDLNLKGKEYAPELSQLLATWHVNARSALIVDPLSKMLGVDAAVPVIPIFSKEQAITRGFNSTSYFPFSRPLEIAPGAPAGLNVQWLAQTTPRTSFAITNLKSIAKGPVSFVEGRDIRGPLNVAVAVEGKLKDSKAPRNTRLVVFGTSAFATNYYSRFGGNLDLFLNSVSWTMEDESMISIRSKDEGASRVQLSQRSGTFIFILTVILIPALILGGGVVIWAMRKKL